MNGRTGYTVWAAPWLEDGEEWQAFLGANGRVWLFEELADLQATLHGAVDNDLSDHPLWPMLQTLPADQLAPDEGYRFDLDGVPARTEAEADPEVVEEVTESVDMVERIAECCDNGTLLRLLEQPGFADLLGFDEEDEDDEEDEEDEDDEDDEEDEEDEGDEAEAEDDEAEAEDEEDEEDEAEEAGDDGATAEATEEDTAGEDEDDDEDDDAWAEIGTAIRTAWPGLLKKLEECVEWRTAADLPEPAEEVAAAVAAGDEPRDSEADVRFWDSVGIMPVELTLPSGTGYTLRCYVDDAPRFLGTDMTVDVFRSRAGLVDFCQHENTHDLADLETWAEVRDAEDLDVTPPRSERYDLLGVDAQLIGGPTVVDVRMVRGGVDVMRDLAEYCELAGVQAAFGADSPLGTAIKALFATSVGSSILLPAYWSGEGAAAQWRTVLDEVDTCIRWHD